MFRNLMPMLAGLAVMLSSTSANAAWLRFHYVPMEGTSKLVLKPNEFSGAPGEVISLSGRRPWSQPPRITCTMAFYHAYSGRTITVPLALPEGTPNIEHRQNRVIYNYGSYSVQIHFLSDASVDVLYNSGLLREVAPP